MSLPMTVLVSIGTAVVDAYKKVSGVITQRLRKQADDEAASHVAASKKLADLAKKNPSE
jgi:hypothetical protein